MRPGFDKSRKTKSVAFLLRVPAENETGDRNNQRSDEQTDINPTTISGHHSSALKNKRGIGSHFGRSAFLGVHRADQSLGRKLVRHQLHAVRKASSGPRLRKEAIP